MAATLRASSSTSGSCCAFLRTSISLEPHLCSAPASQPIRRCAIGASPEGKKVGVVGLGGLGHMGVKIAHALGAHVVVFTTSPRKKEDALRLGADEIVVSRDADEMQKHARELRFHPRRRFRRARHQRLSQPAPPRRQHYPRRRTAEASRRRCLRPDPAPSQSLRIEHRRHSPKLRRCSISAESTISPPMSK